MVKPTEVRIGLWGATDSGKTTYLAALGLSTLRRKHKQRWTVVGNNDVSDDFLVETTALLEGKAFPHSTVTSTPYSWTISGKSLGDGLPGPLGGEGTVAFTFDVVDPRGSLFAPGSSATAEWIEVLDHFANCDGLVYLHDPLREDNFRYVQGPLNRLARRVGGGKDGGRLPFFLAACVTKYDDPRVFDAALKQGLIVQDPRPPRTPHPADAKRLFESVAGDLVITSLRNFFYPQRVGYFATSAVGFRYGPDGSVDLEDYANVQLVDDAPRITGPVRPVNVLEPLVWLERQIRVARAEAAARARRERRTGLQRFLSGASGGALIPVFDHWNDRRVEPS